MSHTPPERTYEQQRDADRVAALKAGTPDALRAWAACYSMPLFQGPARKESRAWLEANRARIVSERTTA